MVSLIYLICFLDMLGFAIFIPFAPVHVLAIGGSRFLISVLTSLHALLQLICGPLIGSWSDTKGSKALLTQCLFLSLISNLLLLFTSSLYLYVASRILFGFAGHIQILLKALVVTSVPYKEQNDVFGMMGAMAGLSFVAGPVAGGIIHSLDDGFFKLAVLINLFTAVNLGVTFLLPDIKSKQTSEKVNAKPILTELTQAFTNLSKINWNVYWDVFLFKFLAESGFSAFFSTLGIVLIDELGATHGHMAAIISCFSIIMIIMNISMGKINAKFYTDDHSGYRRNFHGFLGMFCIFMFLYLYVGFWSYVFVMMGLGVFRAILDMTWSGMLVSRVTDADKGTIMGSFESIVHMANLVTPLVTGYIGETYGYTESFLISIMFMTGGILIGGYCLTTNKQQLKSE